MVKEPLKDARSLILNDAEANISLLKGILHWGGYTNPIVEERVCTPTRELEDAQFEFFERLALATEYRDDVTGRHTQRVGQFSALLARALRLPEAYVELIRRAAALHDIGKIGIPDGILLKPGKLTEEEFEQMKAHTTIGAHILTGSRFPLLQTAEQIALTHHECWDGSGYPRGLHGEAIPLVGRIVAVADVFDALTHERPYKRAWQVEHAAAEIESQSGRKFDPCVVRSFLRLQERGVFAEAEAADREGSSHSVPRQG